jgi:hypothetical protein
MSDKPDDETEAETSVTETIDYTPNKPIIAYGQKVPTLKMRRPTGSDLLAVGNPVKFSPYTDPPSVEHDYKKVVAMVARLANVPSSSLTDLDPEDLAGLAWTISPFFIPTR